MSADKEVLTGCDAVDSPGASTGAKECADRAVIGAPEKGQALLLEDDPTFREIISDYLTENGYVVVAVKNGGEGVRAVLASDFALVICDLMMPALRGDIFYRAVERISPALSERFIFMTGNREDEWIDEFIKKAGRFILRKPFQLSEMGDTITLLEGCRTFQSVFKADVSSAVGSQAVVASQPDANRDARSDLRADKEKVAAILARPRTLPTEARAGGISHWFVSALVALLLVFSGRAWNQYADARERVAAASAKRLALKVRWGQISEDFEAMLAVRSQIEVDQRRLAGILAVRTNPRWTPVLRFAEAGIEILEVRAREGLDDGGPSEVCIRGVAVGPEPLLMADRFRQIVEKTLGENANRRPVRTRFEQLAGAPGAVPEETRGAFVVIATIGPSQPAAVMKSEEP